MTNSTRFKKLSAQDSKAYARIVEALIAATQPRKKLTPDAWADANRVLPRGSAEPGPFRSLRTPYMIPLERAFQSPLYKGVCGVMGSQMGKTDSTANIIGERLDDDPVPIIYVGPTKHFVEKKWEPRFEAMVDSAASLAAKRGVRSADTKTTKTLNGVNVHFVWGGSAASIAGQEAGLVIVDERDRMGASVEGEGDIVELANARHETYADGKTGVFSTPTLGTVDTMRHEQTGLEHWAKSDAVGSPTWQLWQQGTRHEWMIPCPHCGEYFAPRFRLLTFPNLEPGELNDSNVQLACPQCGALIHESKRGAMNERGVAVSPGQRVVDGELVGDGVASDWFTLWVSGLCSPWRSWVTLARRYVRAQREGSSDKMQAVLNTGAGELYSVTGDAPDVAEVQALKLDYEKSTPETAEQPLPEGIELLLLTVDVQKNRLIYVLRGWSRRRSLESWLVDHGEIYGDTSEPDVWEALEEFRARDYGERALRITRCFVDQKFRTQYVFAFCRRNRNWAFPMAGRLPRDATAVAQRPLSTSSVEVDQAGKTLKGGERGLMRWTLNTDFFKTWVHDRVQLGAKGGFHLPRDVGEDYCRQLVAEARVVAANGRVSWVQKSPDNHALDCEMMQVGCAYSLRLQHFARPQVTPKPPTAPPPDRGVSAPQSERSARRPQSKPSRNWVTQW